MEYRNLTTSLPIRSYFKISLCADRPLTQAENWLIVGRYQSNRDFSDYNSWWSIEVLALMADKMPLLADVSIRPYIPRGMELRCFSGLITGLRKVTQRAFWRRHRRVEKAPRSQNMYRYRSSEGGGYASHAIVYGEGYEHNHDRVD